MIRQNKGFALVEALAAMAVLLIAAGGIASVYTGEAALLNQASHRIEAINYARSAAENIYQMYREKGGLDGGLSVLDSLGVTNVGTHNNAEICTLPDSYFTQKLQGKLSYTVTAITAKSSLASDDLIGRRIDIIVTWKEPVPKTKNMKETLTIIFALIKPFHW